MLPPIQRTLNYSLRAARLKYLTQAKLPLPLFTDGGDDFLFGNIQTKAGVQFIRAGSKLSYTRCREVLLKKLADINHGTVLGAAEHPQLQIMELLITCSNVTVDGDLRTQRTAMLKIP